MLGYQWQHNHHGQYVDGHERPDVVDYQQDIFIPWWKEMERCMQHWSKDGVTKEKLELLEEQQPLIAWRHDESTFYTND